MNSMGGREKRLELQAKDGMSSVSSTLHDATEKTKEGANAVAYKAEELGSEAKAQAKKLTK